MKKFLSVNIVLALLTLCGCTGTQENTETRFLLDTFITVTAECGTDTVAKTFDLCSEYEKLFSRTAVDSDVVRLNAGENDNISDETLLILKRALYFSNLSGGKFDVTICPVSELWDFKNQNIPDRSEIAEALKNVDYQSIEITDSSVNLNGKKIDLGGIAKGYIVDKAVEYLKSNGVKNGIVNSGSSIAVFGNERNVRIRKPFKDSYVATLKVQDKFVSTSGTYERYIEKDGCMYHHILDPETGYSVESDLVSATVINNSAMDGDALSTICILLGKEEAKKLINATDDTEAVFIDTDGKLEYTDGIGRKNGKLYLK